MRTRRDRRNATPSGLVAARFALALVCVVLPAPATSAAAPPPFGALTQPQGAAGCVLQAPGGTNCAQGRALSAPVSVAVSPEGGNVYVASSASDAIAVFARDSLTGELTQLEGTAGCVSNDADGSGPGPPQEAICASGRALDNPTSLAASPDGDNLYATSDPSGTGSDAVAVFARNLDGSLTQLAGSAACLSDGGSDGNSDGADGNCAQGRALKGSAAVTVAPGAGDNVYVASTVSDAVAVFARNAQGALTQPAGTNGCVSNDADQAGPNPPQEPTCAGGRALDGPTAVATSPDGANAYVAAGVSDAVAMFARTTVAGGDPLGKLTQPSGTAGCVVDDPASNIANCANSGRALDGPTSIAISADGKNAYVTANHLTGSPLVAYSALTWLKRRTTDITPTNPLGRLSSDSSPCLAAESPCLQGGAAGRAIGGARSIATSADGGSAYAAASTSSAVAVLRRFPASIGFGGAGYLAQPAAAHGCIVDQPFAPDIAGCDNAGRALGGAAAVAISPDDRNVYVAAQSSNGVAVFGRSLQAAPVCVDLPQTVTAGASTPIALTCTDPDGDPIALALVAQPSHGSLSEIDQATGNVTYTPNPGFPRAGAAGQDSFAFRATDGTDDGAATFQSLTVLSGPAAPEGAPVARGSKAPAIKIFGRAVRLTRRGVARVGLRCRSAGESCAGKLTLRADRARNRASARRPRTATLGKGSFSVPAGKSRLVNIRLSRSGLRLVRRLESIWATATADLGGQAGATATVKRTLLLKAP